jgi:hypothetical protein
MTANLSLERLDSRELPATLSILKTGFGGTQQVVYPPGEPETPPISIQPGPVTPPPFFIPDPWGTPIFGGRSRN